MNVAFWPGCTDPTSASSTLTSSSSSVRSSATLISVTACSVAATALPGSTERDSTTPSIGERIEAFDRLVSSFDSAAFASSTLAFALVSSALARASAAAALSSSAADGTLPPDSRETSRRRARFDCASFTVAAVCASRACAAATDARER